MGVALNKVEFIHGTNADRSVFVENIAANMTAAAQYGLPTFQTKRAVMVAGGPSAADYIDAIRAHRETAEIWCVNGAHDWLRSHCGVRPSVCVVMDANPVADQWIKQPLLGVRYMIASQASPLLLRRLIGTGVRVQLWHAALDNDAHDLMGADATITAPANTVGLHSLQLMLLSGIRHVTVYGMDSSHREGRDHAYDNSGQNAAHEMEFVFQGKSYMATGTWAAQAQMFADLYPRFVKAGMRIDVKGDGLLPAMWKAAHEKMIDDLRSTHDNADEAQG
jgi:hypothetical protein